MPSPFPGMDPYLENPGRWLSFHNSFITHLSDELNQSLGPAYVARPTERVLVEQFDSEPRSIYPDVHVLGTKADLSAFAVAECDPAILIKVAEAEFIEASLEIVDVAGERVVTVLEVLSCSNKTPGVQGREAYLRKQREVRSSHAHLVEIDLLRGGGWTIAAPEHLVRRSCSFDYIVSVNRAGARSDYQLYPILLPRRLPRMGVPLGGQDPDVVVDLQKVLTRCYERGKYDLLLDYTKDPVPPLELENAAWVDGLLRGAGRRRGA